MLDQELVSKFVRERSQEAFAEIVRRHVDAVYASARRQVRDAQLAEDVTQAVFIVLMRKAKTLRPEVPLIGWLLKTTHFASRDALKAEMRRRKHEERAAAMHKTIEPPVIPDISPELDRAVARLHEMDRGIIAMRFMEDKSVAEIAAAIGLSHDAAAKRLTRAVGKLRQMLLRRQNISTAVSTEAMLAAIPRMVAPPHLAGASISAASGSSITASSVIAKGATKMMLWTHTKAAMVLIAGAAAVGVTAVGAHSLVRAQAAPTPAVAVAQPATAATPPRASRCIGKLNNGVSIEILGIAEHDDATGQPIQWWAPNGSELDFGPYAAMGAASITSRRPRDIEREMAVRVNDQLIGNGEKASTTWYFVHAGATSGSLPRDEQGKIMWNSDIDAQLMALPDDPAGATLHLKAATGPWKTHLIKSPAESSSMAEGDTSLLASQCFEVDRQAHVIVTIASSKPLPDEAERLIAMTASGKTIQAYAATEGATDNAVMMEMVIPSPLRDIKELRFQTRPWNQWIEIRHIALHANQKTDLQIVTSDRPQAPTAPK